MHVGKHIGIKKKTIITLKWLLKSIVCQCNINNCY